MNIGKRIRKKTEEGILRREAPRNFAFLEGSNEGKLDIFGDFHHKFGDTKRQKNGRQLLCGFPIFDFEIFIQFFFLNPFGPEFFFVSDCHALLGASYRPPRDAAPVITFYAYLTGAEI